MDLELGLSLFTGLDEDGFPVAQFDGHGDDPGVDSSELQHPFGFASRPRDPENGADGQPLEGKACALWRFSDGDQTKAWLGYDPRYIATFPKLKKGGSMQYSAPGSFQVLDGDDGTWTLYVPVPGNKAHAITVGLDGNGDLYLGIVHANGMAVTMLNQALVAKNAAGDAYIELNAAGVVLNGNVRHNGAMVMGSTAAVPLVLGPPLLTLLGTLAGIIDAKTPAGPAASAAVSAAAATLQALLVKGS